MGTNIADVWTKDQRSVAREDAMKYQSWYHQYLVNSGCTSSI